AAERTQQDTTQTVSTEGLFPQFDGVFTTPYRENLLTGKVTSQINAQQYLAVRYGRNTNSQPYGASSNTAPTTEQHKFQFRDDFSWHKGGWGGLGHDMKAGVNFINEPRLFITFNSGKGVLQHTHLDNNVNGPLSIVQLNDGDASANI